MFRIIFCAVPAFILDEPAMTSGPTIGAIETAAAVAIREAGLQVIATVAAPSFFAYSIAPAVYGVLPLADIPTNTSCAVTPHDWRSRSAWTGSSSAASTDRCSASYPPAIMPRTRAGGTPNVGGHSE